MKHPVALGVGLAILLGLVGTAALRVATLPPPAATVTDGIDHARLWQAILPDLAGRGQSLGQWRGKVLVVNFWAPWCPPCRQEIPGFIRLQQRYASRGLQFVGVALDTPDKVSAYAEAVGIPYPLLLGEAAAVDLARAAGNHSGGLPYTLILDRQGNPVASHVGALAEERLEALIEPLI